MPGNSEDQMRKMSGSRLLLCAAEFPLPTSMAQWAVPITIPVASTYLRAGGKEEEDLTEVQIFFRAEF